MKHRFPFPTLPIALAFVMAHSAGARPGTVTWSDGRTITGDLTLTPGKQLKLFTSGAPVEFPLAEVKEIRFTPEKEQMAQGFYFPNAGQATQAKTDDIYPVRYLHAQFTMPDGRVLEGHLFTTVLYVQNTGRGVRVQATETAADIRNLAGSLDSDIPGGRQLIENRAFLVAFAREMIVAQAQQGVKVADAKSSATST